MDELTRASKEARSVPEAPIDMEYIGSIQGKYEEFHYYKKADKYYYETNYDRTRREELKKKRIRRYAKKIAHMPQTDVPVTSATQILNHS